MINFWIFLDLPLINCEIELTLSWSKEWIISKTSITSIIPANPPAQEMAAIQTTGVKFQINNAKLYVSVVTLSINDNTNFLENIKQGFKRTISWKKYRKKYYLIDPTFININRLFTLSFKEW